MIARPTAGRLTSRKTGRSLDAMPSLLRLTRINPEHVPPGSIHST
jgi:hypothetical protein